ncbi:hypothetical protein GCM10027030_03250 [Luteococcus sediminum]
MMLAPPTAVQRDLDPPAAHIQSIPSEPDDMEGIHHRGSFRQFFGRGSLEAGEPVHRHDPDPISPSLGLLRQPRLEGLLRTAFDHRQQPRRSGPGADGGQVDDHGDVLVAAAGVAPHVLVDADHCDALEAAGGVDEHPLAFGEDGVVGGVPRHVERGRDVRHGQVVDHQRFQRPPQCTS